MRFCFVAQNIYPLLSKKNDSNRIGGAELQQNYIGDELARRGYQIQFITQDFGQDDVEIADDKTVYKTFREDTGIPVFRFVYPRLFKIWNALKATNADIYYVRSAGFIVGVVAYFCMRSNKKIIYAAAHDTDFIPGRHIIRMKRDAVLYHFGLKHCDKVIVQSAFQKKLLKENFGIKGQLIRNFSPNPVVNSAPEDKRNILWVATIRTWKRPDYFINLAEKFQDENFILIGGEDVQNPSLFSHVMDRCKRIRNISFLGFKSLTETEAYFDTCKVFVNTSEHEGFPNTFLQAWRRGIPVLSFVDPDHLIINNNLGVAVNSEAQLESGLTSLLSAVKCNSKAIQAYYLKHHSSRVVDKYVGMIEQLTT